MTHTHLVATPSPIVDLSHAATRTSASTNSALPIDVPRSTAVLFRFGDCELRFGGDLDDGDTLNNRRPLSDTDFCVNFNGDVVRADGGAGEGDLCLLCLGDGAFSNRHTRRIMQSTSTAHTHTHTHMTLKTP